MTVVELELVLPESLAQAAAAAGLLTSEVIERLLREELRRQQVDALFDVADRLAAEFEKCSWSDASIPVAANVSALPVSSVSDIRKSLYEQTYSPVLWSKSVEHMADKGVSLFAEIGPGTVLSGLVKRCRKGLTTMSACTPESLEEVAHVLRNS